MLDFLVSPMMSQSLYKLYSLCNEIIYTRTIVLIEMTPQKLNEPFSNTMIDKEKRYRDDIQAIEQASSRCSTPTFGSRMKLSSVEETLA